MIVDLLSATSDSFFALLDGASWPSGTKVGTNFKEGDQPPIVMLGEVGSEPGDEDDVGQLERVTVQIVVIYRGTDKSVLLGMMNTARAALDRQTPTATHVEFGRIKFTGQTASGPGEDGVTHAGSVEFEVLAQPQ